MKTLLMTISRDLKVAYRNPADVINPLVFFVIVISLFPLGISPSADVLVGIAPGVIWVAALLSCLLSFELMFRSDYEDGSLEQMTFGSGPFILVIMGKIVSHWIMTGLPLALLSPLLGMMLFVPPPGLTALMLSLLLATPTLSLLGSVGAGLTVGLRKGGVLVAILVLPLFVPVLILATAMVQTGIQGGDYTGHMLWLGALLAIATGISPLATSAAVRISLSH
ncbi:MAG: heme exporter protein CcmB [Pseudomonadales bacterium]|nr:heme exporter protein CcmB [Pseudomonadales bacterium]